MHKEFFTQNPRMIHRNEDRKFVEREFVRMGFDKDARWRISDINKDFELCNTYPRFLIIPSNFKDDDLESVAKFRYFRRIPTAVWRHIKNGCFIIRSSQPTVGWFGWFRNDFDESLVHSYVNNTLPPNSDRNNHNNSAGDVELNESVNKNNDDALCDQQKLVDNNQNGEKENNDDNNDEEKTKSQNQAMYLNQHQFDSGKAQQQQQNHNNNLQDTSKEVPISGNGKIPTHTAKTTAVITTITTTVTKTTPAVPVAATTITTITTSSPSSIIKQDPTADTENQDIISSETSTSIQSTIALTNINVNGNGTSSLETASESDTTAPVTSKLLIIDARSYTAAMANRAKGGGCECSEYYQRCEVQFMNLANIHSIRKSYQRIRGVCEAYSEQSNNWVSSLDNSGWLYHISGLLKSALLVVDTIDIEEKSILIHCSDGWDRTPQLVALAEIMLDPHYRTFEGFRTLIQREWLDFGHKFADRCGSNPSNEDPNERCPVFLQWLDCVQQLLVQYPKHFEFNSFYLDKLNRHTYSNIFGTFSNNSTQERILSRVDDRLLSLWPYFESSKRRFRNDKYVESDDILRPSFKVRDLHFWKEVYLPPLRNQVSYMPIANNIDNKKFYDSLYIDGLTGTVCK